MQYKGFNITKIGDTFIIKGASHYEPTNITYGWCFSNVNECKSHINNLLKSWNVKNWKSYETN